MTPSTVRSLCLTVSLFFFFKVPFGRERLVSWSFPCRFGPSFECPSVVGRSRFVTSLYERRVGVGSGRSRSTSRI